MAVYLTGTLLFSGWIDYRRAAGSNLETRIDLVKFLFDTTSASMISEIQRGEHQSDGDQILEVLEAMEKDLDELHKDYEYIIDNPGLKAGVNLGAISDKHNAMEKDLSKIVQRLMSFQIAQDMIDKSTIHEFYMYRRHGQEEKE